MMRGFVFLLIFLAANLGVVSVVDWLGFRIQPGSYIDGLIAAGVFGLLWFWLENWTSNILRPGKAQSVSMQTKQTPSQIIWGAVREILRGVVLIVIIGALSVWLITDLFRR